MHAFALSRVLYLSSQVLSSTSLRFESLDSASLDSTRLDYAALGSTATPVGDRLEPARTGVARRRSPMHVFALSCASSSTGDLDSRRRFARLDSTSLRSARLGSASLCSARLRFASARLRFAAARLDSTRHRSTSLDSTVIASFGFAKRESES